MTITRHHLPLIYSVLALLPIAAVVLQLLLGRFLPKRGLWLPTWTSFVVFASTWWLLTGTALMRIDEFPEYACFAPALLGDWSNIFRIDIAIDSATLAFACVLSGCLWLVSIASAELCLKWVQPRLLMLASVGMSMCLWLLVADNIMMLAVLWTLLGLVAYAMLDAAARETDELRGARTFLLMLGVGNACLLIATALLASVTGRVDCPGLIQALDSPTALKEWRYGIEVLLTLGFVLNLAVFPVRAWFVATSGATFLGRFTGSVIMGATGVFLLARYSFLFSQKLLVVLGLMSLLSAVISGLAAAVSRTSSRVVVNALLAQIGLAVAATAFGAPRHGLTYAWLWCITSTLLVIWSVGIERRAGTAELSRLGGLKPYMPLTFWLGFCGLWSAALIPPFAGFWSGGALVDLLMAFGLDRRTASLVPATGFMDFVIPAALVIVAGTVAFGLFRLLMRAFVCSPHDKTVLNDAREWPIEVIFGAAALAVSAMVLGELFPVRNAWLKTEHTARLRQDRFLFESEARRVPRDEEAECDQWDEDYEEADMAEYEEQAVMVETLGVSRKTVAYGLAAGAGVCGCMMALLMYWPKWSLGRRLRIFDPAWYEKRFGFVRKLLD